MAYEDNVQKLCDEFGIDNPIQEEDLRIKAVSFMVNGEHIFIVGTKMNRGARLFFQTIFRDYTWRAEFAITEFIRHAATGFFAERWLDAEQAGRQLLTTFKLADSFTLYRQCDLN